MDRQTDREREREVRVCCAMLEVRNVARRQEAQRLAGGVLLAEQCHAMESAAVGAVSLAPSPTLRLAPWYRAAIGLELRTRCSSVMVVGIGEVGAIGFDGDGRLVGSQSRVLVRGIAGGALVGTADTGVAGVALAMA
jgi:hypothetical protein